MARDIIRYFDWEDANTGYRYRAEFIPPDPTTALADNTPPAWKGNPTDGYDPLPDLSIVGEGAGGTAYPTSLPTGAPTAPTQEFTFDMSLLVGTTNLELFRGYLLEGEYPGSSTSLIIDSPHTAAPFMAMETTAVTMVVTVYCDRGQSLTDVAAFDVTFQGAALRNPTRTTAFNYKNDTAFRTMTFISIARAVWEMITPDHVAEYILCFGNTTTNDYVYDDGDTCSNTIAFDALWKSGSTIHGVASCARGPAEQRFRFRCMSLVALFEGIADLTMLVYRKYVRREDATFRFWTMNTGDGLQNIGTPYDYLALYRRDYTSANVRGSELSGSITDGYGKSNTYFIAAGWQDADTTYDVDSNDLAVALENDELVFGLFAPSDPESVYAFPHLQDLTTELFSGTGAKGALQWTSDRDMRMLFVRPADSTELVRTGLAPSQMWVDGDIEVHEGQEAGVIRAFRCAYPGASDEDLSEMLVASSSGALGDGEAGVTMFFHNAPALLSEESFHPMGVPLTFSNIDEIDGTDYRIYAYPRYRCRALYYFDEPSGVLDVPCPILVHEQVLFAAGWGSASAVGTAMTLANFDNYKGLSTGDTTTANQRNLTRYRARALVHQSEAGIGYAIASEFLTRFSAFRMWKMSVEVDRDRAYYGSIGKRLRLNNEAGASTGLVSLAPTAAASYSGHPHYAYIVSVQWTDSGAADITLLAIPS